MNVPTIAERFAGATTETIVDQWLDGFFPCNPSIAQGPDGYAVMVTCRDLVRHDDGSHSFADATGVIRTRNFFAPLDEQSLRLAAPLVELAQPDEPIRFGPVLGVEDPRLYWQDEWCYSGSIAQHHSSGEPRTALCTVADGLHDIVDAPSGTWVKNLMPTGSEPAFIDIMAQRDDLHGGAVTAYEDGYLGIVHDVIWPGRRYRHYFARLNSSGDLIAITEPFTFGGTAIEFSSGIVLDHEDVVLSYGVQDREARLARIRLEHVLEAL